VVHEYERLNHVWHRSATDQKREATAEHVEPKRYAQRI